MTHPHQPGNRTTVQWRQAHYHCLGVALITKVRRKMPDSEPGISGAASVGGVEADKRPHSHRHTPITSTGRRGEMSDGLLAPTRDCAASRLCLPYWSLVSDEGDDVTRVLGLHYMEIRTGN